LITKDNKEHISMMSFIESFFMVGIFSGYFIFSSFIDDKNPLSGTWFHVYYLLGVLSTIAFALLLASPLDESAAKGEKTLPLSQDIAGMLKLIILPVVVSFLVCAFIYVLIEQSIMSWLPTFNNKVLQLPSSISIQMASVLAASYALGRFFAGVVLKKFSWFVVLIFCLAAAAVLVLLALPLASNAALKQINGWGDVPFAAYIFPLIGFLLAPIYPAINSVILGSLPKSKHGFMSGLIVVFSALGGTLGSVITGFIFQYYGGKTAFYFSLVPMAILAVALFIFDKIKNKKIITVPPLANQVLV
jgi:MFS transporter, FHS family, glucose/mannose:H+ symporter